MTVVKWLIYPYLEIKYKMENRSCPTYFLYWSYLIWYYPHLFGIFRYFQLGTSYFSTVRSRPMDDPFFSTIVKFLNVTSSFSLNYTKLIMHTFNLKWIEYLLLPLSHKECHSYFSRNQTISILIKYKKTIIFMVHK